MEPREKIRKIDDYLDRDRLVCLEGRNTRKGDKLIVEGIDRDAAEIVAHEEESGWKKRVSLRRIEGIGSEDAWYEVKFY